MNLVVLLCFLLVNNFKNLINKSEILINKSDILINKSDILINKSEILINKCQNCKWFKPNGLCYNPILSEPGIYNLAELNRNNQKLCGLNGKYFFKK